MLRFISEELDTVEEIRPREPDYDSVLLRLQVIACRVEHPLPAAAWSDLCSSWNQVWSNLSDLSEQQFRQCLTLWMPVLPWIVEDLQLYWRGPVLSGEAVSRICDAVNLMVTVVHVGLKSLSRSVREKLAAEAAACVLVVDAIAARIKVLLRSDKIASFLLRWEEMSLAKTVLLRLLFGCLLSGDEIEISDGERGLGEIATELRDSILAHVRAFADSATRTLIVSDLASQKWSSSAKFFGGRVPTHSIPFLFTLCASIVRQGVATLSVEHSKPLAALSVGNLLKTALEGFSHIVSQISPSAARAQQLIVDAIYLVRIGRILRDVVSESCGSLDCHLPNEVNLLLLHCAAVVAKKYDASTKKSSADEDVAAPQLVVEDFADFHSIVWNAKAVTFADIVDASTEELSVLSPSFIRYVPHSQLSGIRFPSLLAPTAAFGVPPVVGRPKLADMVSL
jgi:hypothetical protein